MLIDVKASQLLIVDVQERLLPAMTDPEGLLRNTRILIACARELGVPVTVSEQYPAGLGATVPNIQEALATGTARHAKLEFSCLRDAGLRSELDALKAARPQLLITGIEAHVCVLQSALDAVDAGYSVFVVEDAISSRKEASRLSALRRLGNAATLVTTEMVVFEWLQRAGTDVFRSLSKLVR